MNSTTIDESPLEFVDSDLDLLNVMSTWPEIFRTSDSITCQSDRKSVRTSVRKSLKRKVPVVRNDLNGQSLQIQVIQPINETRIESNRKCNNSVNYCYSDVKLIKVK